MPDDAIDWEWGSVQNLITVMGTLDAQFDVVSTYMKNNVLDTSGLTGALEPLATFFDRVKGLVDGAGEHYHTAWGNLINATEVATNYLERVDDEIGSQQGGGN